MLRALLLLTLCSPAALCQLDDAWIEFERDDGLISVGGAISGPSLETDLAWDDLDADGDIDLVVVRSQPYITVGKRSNLLLMNEAGVLTDRTVLFASASDVPGDLGFRTPTQDRDVVAADVTGDGWVDVVTAADLWQPGDAKAITHPRVYRNQGDGGGSSWLGLLHEDFRVPQILVGGLPGHPRFLAVAAGDVDDDGDLDLYFGDHDFLAQSVAEPGAEDANDRLFLNDGSGVFSDGTLSVFTASQVDSMFHNAVAFADFNQDGLVDLLQEDGYFDPTTIAYNQLASPGVLTDFDEIYSGTSGYFANTGDLNNDGRIDIAISDNGTDKYLVNTGNDGNGHVVWGPATQYQFVSGGDGGIGANNLIVDLNDDGWDEVLIADMDPEIPGTNRRLQIYHNLRGTPGSIDVRLQEERQSALDTDWIGVKGMDADDLRATHDVAVFDVDGDGLLDMVVSQLAGTFVWRQLSVWTDLGLGLAGVSGVPRLVGSGTLEAGSTWSVTVHDAAPSAPVAFIVGLSAINAPFKGGTFVPNPDVILSGLTTTALGNLTVSAPWPSGLPIGTSVFHQAWVTDATGPKGFAASDAQVGVTP
jgi:hypothetical protein